MSPNGDGTLYEKSRQAKNTNTLEYSMIFILVLPKYSVLSIAIMKYLSYSFFQLFSFLLKDTVVGTPLNPLFCKKLNPPKTSADCEP